MRRSKVLIWGTLALGLLLVAPLEAPSQPSASSECRIALSDDVDVPPHQVVGPGTALEATYTAQAIQGDWTVGTNVAAEHGRIQGQADDVELAEGDEREVVVRVRVADVPDGTYSVGIFASARCSSAEERERTIYGFEVTVAQTQPVGSLSDPQGDHVTRSEGESIDNADAADLTGIEATLAEGSARFQMSFAEPVPSLQEEASLRVGCYLDTFGTSTLLAPFEPRGFERLAQVSWHPDAASTRVADDRGETVSNPIDVALNDERTALVMEVSGLNWDRTAAWLCFAETERSSRTLLDIVPNDGGPFRGWLTSNSN